MRLFPVNKPAFISGMALVAGLALSVAPQGAWAQASSTSLSAYRPPAMYSTGTPAPQPAQSQPAPNPISNQQQLQAALNSAMLQGQQGTASAAVVGGQKVNSATMTQDELDADLSDHDSPQYKAYQLAKKAKSETALSKESDGQAKQQSVTEDYPAPPVLEKLQNVAASHPGESISDDPVSRAMSMDLRRDSQREAALSYGARGGLAKRSFEIMERLHDYDTTFDRVFNFRALLIRAPSGLMIEPPIVSEELNATVITPLGDEAAVSDQVLKINKQAKIVTAPRDWREYLDMHYASVIVPPPRVLWPKNKTEQMNWNEWVKQGWDAGYQQGEQIFEASIAKLVADYRGMIRYRMLLAQGKISQPYALQEDRGVTGGKNVMRVGDRALRITGPSQFLTGADLWKPADR